MSQMGVTSTGCRRQARTKRESGADIKSRLTRRSRNTGSDPAAKRIPKLFLRTCAPRRHSDSLELRIFPVARVLLEAARGSEGRDLFRRRSTGEGLSIVLVRRFPALQTGSAFAVPGACPADES